MTIRKMNGARTSLCSKLFLLTIATALMSCQAHGSPTSSERGEVRIGLSRGACFGMCPIYSVQIEGDGTVTYFGERFVAIEGQHKTKISPQEVDALLKQFEAAGFFSLLDEYRAEVTDNPTITIGLQVGDRKKMVVDYVGRMAGMPPTVTALELEIDRVAGTGIWINASPELVESLKAEDFDFKSDAAADMLAAVVSFNQPETAKAFLAEGTKPTGRYAGVPALALAASKSNAEIAEALLAAGADKAEPQQLTDALWFAATAGNLPLVKRLIALGADPKGHSTQTEGGRGIPSADGSPVLFAATTSCDLAVVNEILNHGADAGARDATGRNAVFTLAEQGKCEEEGNKGNAPAILKALGGKGAKLDVHSADGRSPLMSTYSEEMVRALLDAGANVNLRNTSGDTALLATYSEDIALILMKAGADVSVRNAAGQTILDRAQQNGWQKVIAELSKR